MLRNSLFFFVIKKRCIITTDINASKFVPKGVYDKSQLEGLDSWNLTSKKGVDSKGRNYQVYTKEIVHKDFGWKFLKGLAAFAATFFSLGLALISKDIRDLWKQSINGKENRTIKVLTELPPTEDKTRAVHRDILPPAPTKPEAPIVAPEPEKLPEAAPVVEEKPAPVVTPLEAARNALLEWAVKDGSTLGQGEYVELAAKVKELSKDLPRVEMTLHRFAKNWGFRFFYGEKPGEEKFIPISWADGVILNWQSKNAPDALWPIKDPQSNTYFCPKSTTQTISWGTGSAETAEYIDELLREATWIPSSRRVLEALTPYAKEIKDQCGDRQYQRLRVLIPAYPENP